MDGTIGTVTLDFDGVLHMKTDEIDFSWLTGKAFYKSRLIHKVGCVDGDTIYFKPDLTYMDFIKISGLLSEKIPKTKRRYVETIRLKDYISARNIYIEKRANLGIELKTDPIRLDERYLKFKSVVEEHMKRKLREKQMRDAFFMFAMSRSGNFSVPGSGKTTSALAVYAFLKANDLIDRIVMIGPKNAFGSWMDEFKACFEEKDQLKCFNIQDQKFSTVLERKLSLKYESANCNLFLFNYESVETYIEEITKIVEKRTLLIFDEVHKIKAINGQRATASLEISKYATYTIAMTGTPIPNSYLDLYNLLHILFDNEYKDFFGFDISYLRNPTPTDMEIINDRIQPFFCRTTKKELQVPDANEDIIFESKVTDIEQRIFDILCQKYRSNQLALFMRILQLETNPELLLEKLDLNDFRSVLEITENIDDIDFVDYSQEIATLIRSISITSKKHLCIEKIKELVSENKKVVVWCIFIDSIKDIQRLLEENGIKAKYIIGEVKLEDRIRFINEFKSGKFDVLITNPHTLAESVSLHSVCHDAIYFEYSYNLVHLLQSKDRIHRLGLSPDQYTQYYYLQNFYRKDGEYFSVDKKVYERLVEKEQVMLDAIDSNELEPVYTPEEDLKIIFGNLL